MTGSRGQYWQGAWRGVVVAFLWMLAGCGGGDTTTLAPEDDPSQHGDVVAAQNPWSLRQATGDTFTTQLRTALGQDSVQYQNKYLALDAVAEAAPTTAGAAAFSETTVQEIGVDELDVVKSDGVDVYSLDPDSSAGTTRSLLRRHRFDAAAADASLLKIDTLTLPFSKDVRGLGIYLDTERKQLIALAAGDGGGYDRWFTPAAWTQGGTELAFIDVSDPTTMRLLGVQHISAQWVGSRRVGSTLYLVLRNTATVPGLDASWQESVKAENEDVLQALDPKDVLPTIAMDGGTPTALVDPESCLVQPDNGTPSADIVTIAAIDVANAGSRHAARCFLGGTEAFYLSTQSIYLATTRTPYAFSGRFIAYAGKTSTDIHKFALDGLQIAYRGSGNVPGHLGFDPNRKSFRLGEHEGSLRVVTQTEQVFRGWVGLAMADATTASDASTTADAADAAEEESPGHLSILQERSGSLVVVGELPNAARPAPLGKSGEQLYASRFLGMRGYLVTYRLTDPLYVLDLSDPTDPYIAGELHVEGYSDYLFPLTDTLLLGVGKDAVVTENQDTSDGRFAWYQGVKLSLIDLRDPANPKEAARHIIGQRGTNATVLHDHHGIALLRVGQTVRVALPVQVHETPSTWATGAPNDYYDFTRNELHRYDIDLAKPDLQPRVPMQSVVEGMRDTSSDRAQLWNEQVHYYQNGDWSSQPW
ncbi:beta-propeller domain-containing protein [Candidatus Symbiobacter mobilis]|uniref:Extracellular protein n=1 Tax=Candidatus Symbiobacter mobilis CR TaxID=946483 RepID=U5N6F7_9BURK|nr:beta-propeller domain-containing protein [Candidatus Symbiobacter mobilis]AGX86952.1 extracellular protein [Candidatus Symbiobacter mobilis CR]